MRKDTQKFFVLSDRPWPIPEYRPFDRLVPAKHQASATWSLSRPKEPNHHKQPLIPQSLSPSLSLSVPPSLSPSVSQSLSPSLSPSLPPSLPPSLSPSLPQSLSLSVPLPLSPSQRFPSVSQSLSLCALRPAPCALRPAPCAPTKHLLP